MSGRLMFMMKETGMIAMVVTMTRDELFSCLERSELRRVVAQAHVPLEEVEQEAHVKCLEIERGVRSYTEQGDGPRRYLMGCLWAWARRECLEPACAGHALPDGQEEIVPRELCSQQPVDTLIARRERERNEWARQCEEAGRLAGMKKAGAPWYVLLAAARLSRKDMAALAGISRQAIEKKLRQESSFTG